MRIAIFEPKFLTSPPNAASYLVTVQRQARTLASMGHQVIVLTEGNKEVTIEEPNLTIYPLKGIFTPLGALFSASRRNVPIYSAFPSPDIPLRALRRLKEAAVDVIYSCGTSFMGVAPAFLGRMTNLPTVHYIFQYAGSWNWWRVYNDTFKGFKVPLKYTILETMKNSLYQPFRFEFVHRWGLRNLTQIIASSCYVKKSLANSGLEREAIPVIYPGVDIPVPRNAVSSETPLVTYMGHLWQGRGVLDLLIAFARITEHHPKARLVMAITNVNDLTERHFEALINEYRLGPKIVRLGIVPDPGLEVMASATVIVLPYRDMPSIKLLQAMAWGKPVVTTNTGWAGEIITDGANGFLVKPGDTDGLAHKIEMVLANRELAEKVGKKARETAEEKFSLEGSTSALLEILQQAVARTKSGKPS